MKAEVRGGVAGKARGDVLGVVMKLASQYSCGHCKAGVIIRVLGSNGNNVT
jgi:hypothetical protein